MPINIKEIFKSDLDPNSANWWAKDKVDKLNFNFNQLKDGGAPGPQGTQGFDGSTGPVGMLGYQGDVGPYGYQGLEGISGLSQWKRHFGSNNDTILPNFQGGGEYSSIPVVLGLGLGLDNNPGDNTDHDALYTNGALSWSQSSFQIYRSGPRHSLTFDHGGTDVKVDFGFDADLSGDPTLQAIQIGKRYSSIDRLNINTDLTTVTTNYFIDNSSNSSLEISKDILRDTIGIVETQGTTINNDFKYTTNVQSTKVLVPTDTDGTMAWKNKYEVFGALPLGSIIQIKESDFNTTNFELTPAGELNKDGYFEFTHGRGRENTPFEGWYLANGQTWELAGIITYQVPNLNQFEYSIAADPDGIQPSVAAISRNPVIIAGSKITSTSTYDNISELYETTIVKNDNDETIYGDTSGSTSMSVHSNVQIINIGQKGLYWKSVASSAAPTETITLSESGDDIYEACTNTNQAYHWTGVGITWSNLTADLSGVLLFTDNGGNPGLPATASKWYEKDDVARYWDGSAFTQVIECPIIQNINLVYVADVTTINGNIPSTHVNADDYIINEVDFKDATTLTLNGVNAPGGWYRETDDDFGTRRYWDGNNFKEESIETRNVYYADELELSLSGTDTACNDPNRDAYSIYYATDSLSPTGGDPLDDIYATTGVVYVNKDWTGTAFQAGKFPIVKIINQPKQGTSTTYRTIVDISGLSDKRGVITVDSKINQPVNCTAGNTLSGDTILSVGNTNGNGTISVINAPATLTIIGKTTSSSDSVEGEMQALNLGIIDVNVPINSGTPHIDTDSIVINQTGIYSYYIEITSYTGTSGTVELKISQ